jgi:putative FmdB family regulatory protein
VPTYVYACDSCGNRYEKRESFSASPRQKCPTCGKTAQRVIFAPPIVFKGSGFYSTDSRASNGSEDGASPDSAAASSNGHGHSHGDGSDTHDATEASAAS